MKPFLLQIHARKLRVSPYFLICWAILLMGCGEISYYQQAVEGHFDILDRKVKIDTLLNDPQTSPELARKLTLIQNVRQFAIDRLQLPDVQGYTAYADIEKPHVSTVVTAAHALKLEPYQWCFLFVGCVGYRGYFDPAEAKAYAEELKKEGWDIALGNVRAYSTLKWLNNDFMPDYFKDPILNTFIERSDTAIIRTLLHEMAHQIVFISGDTAFNESFAVFVEQEGLRQYLEQSQKADLQEYQRYLLGIEDRERFLKIIATFYQKFENLYDSPISPEEKLKKKEMLFEAVREAYRRQADEFKAFSYASWFERPLNNAHLLGVRRYNNWVPTFRQIFNEEGRNWPKFFNKIKEIADFSSEERGQYLQSRSPKKTML